MNKLYLIMFIYLFAMNCYCLYKIKKISIEGFAETNNTDLIKKEISKIYQADIDAIRNLASIAEKLQSGGKNGLLTIPGNVKIEGALEVDKNVNVQNDVKLKNLTSSGNIKGIDFNVVNINTNSLKSSTINNSKDITVGGNVKSNTINTKIVNTNTVNNSKNLNVKGNINLSDNTSKIISGPNYILMTHWGGFEFKSVASGAKFVFSNWEGTQLNK